jgi:hypothetical protein
VCYISLVFDIDIFYRLFGGLSRSSSKALFGDDERGRLAIEPLLLATKTIHLDALPHCDSAQLYAVEEITLSTMQMQVVRQLVFKYPKVAYDITILQTTHICPGRLFV